MLKTCWQIALSSKVYLVYCDICGEGISNDNTNAVTEFCKLHKDCQKPKNNNLNFLKKAEPYV